MKIGKNKPLLSWALYILTLCLALALPMPTCFSTHLNDLNEGFTLTGMFCPPNKHAVWLVNLILCFTTISLKVPSFLYVNSSTNSYSAVTNTRPTRPFLKHHLPAETRPTIAPAGLFFVPLLLKRCDLSTLHRLWDDKFCKFLDSKPLPRSGNH